MLRDIPREEWDYFLDRFSRQHRDEPVTVAKSELRDGLQIAERAVPLMAITHNRATQRIAITVGDTPSARSDAHGHGT